MYSTSSLEATPTLVGLVVTHAFAGDDPKALGTTVVPSSSGVRAFDGAAAAGVSSA